jgi:hypothetical protein
LQPKQLATVHYKVLLLFAAKANSHCALESFVVVCSLSNWSLSFTKCCFCLQAKQMATVHYKVLLLFAG